MAWVRSRWLSIALLVVGIGVCTASWVGVSVYSGSIHHLDPVWTVIARGGRVVASRHSLLSSYYSEPERPGWLNAGGFSFEKRRFPGKGGLVSGKVMAQHIAVPTYPLIVIPAIWLAWGIRRAGKQPGAGA